MQFKSDLLVFVEFGTGVDGYSSIQCLDLIAKKVKWILDINGINLLKGLIGLHLNISEESNVPDLDLAREVAEKFRVNKAQCEFIIEKITESISHWHEEAKKINISRSEILQMETAFYAG
jgi:hypothetical protein